MFVGPSLKSAALDLLHIRYLLQGGYLYLKCSESGKASDQKINMGSASQSLCSFLLLVSASDFLLINSEHIAWNLDNKLQEGRSSTDLGFVLGGREEAAEKVSGQDNVSRDMGSALLEKFRFLLALKNFSNARRPDEADAGHEGRWLSPAAAPAEETPNPTPVSPFHARLDSLSPAHTSEDGRKSTAQGRVRTVVTLVASAGAVIFIFSVMLILACKRSRRMQRKPRKPRIPIHSNSTSKVSFDPGPDLFYLNSLAKALGSDSSLKQNFETTFVLPNESGFCFPSYDGEATRCIGDVVSCCDEEIPPVQSPFTDNGSFCSVYDSSKESSSPFFQGPTSPYCNLDGFSPRQSLASPTSEDSDKSIEVNKIDIPDIAVPSSSLQLASTPSCPPPNDSKRFPPMKEASSSCSLQSSSMKPQDPQATISSTIVSKPTQSRSMSSVSNTNVPKPPPPPLPPLNPPTSQKGCNTRHPPLPPLCKFQQPTPIGKDVSPLPKLKPLHWDKVRAAPNRSTVWDKIRSGSFELDEEMIESLFRYKAQTSVENGQVQSKASSPSKHVLEPKRLQNIAILLNAFHATAEQVSHALMQGNGLCVQQLEALVKMVPTKDEEENLLNYEGDIDELSSTEKFMKELLSIPFAFSRTEAMLYKETFEDEVSQLRKSFAMLEEACKQLRSSTLFLRLLEAVLNAGNRLNFGTVRGGARAFKLDALLKLSDIRGRDGKTTLLQFVLRELVRSQCASVVEKDVDLRTMCLDFVSRLSTELCSVKNAASIDLDVLKSSVSNLSNGIARLKRLVGKDLSMDERNWSFVHSMQSFLKCAEQVVTELQNDEDQVVRHVKEITEYYHGDASRDDARGLQIFAVVRDFLATLDRECKETGSFKANQGSFR